MGYVKSRTQPDRGVDLSTGNDFEAAVPLRIGVPRNWRAYGLLAPALLTLLVLAALPLLLVLRNSFAIADNYGGVTGGFTLDNYSQLFDPVYLKVLGYSLGVAGLASGFCIVVGYFTAAYIVSRPAHRQALLVVLIVVPLWADFLVRTFAWINLLGRDGPLLSALRVLGLASADLQWVPSQGATLMGLLYTFLPVAIFPIYASMRSIDPTVREAASDLGCGWWGVQRHVLIPLCRFGIVASGVLTFIPTLGVFVIPVLLGGGKDQLVGNVIVTLYTEFRNQPMGAAASMVLFVLMAVVIALGALFLAGRRQRRVRT